MDDFFKTKVGFTIGLLAAVFAFKPLVDANSDLGFMIFKVKITVEYAYLFLTAFLGLAVYFISLQFASSKHVRLLDKVSDTCYSIALATPPVFIALWFTTSTLGFLGKFVSQIPETMINFFAGVLTSIFAAFIYQFLIKSIREKFLAAEKVQERKADIEQLARAQELFNSGMFDMSVLESSKVLESVVRRLLLAKGISTQQGHMHELVKLSEKHRILSSRELDMLNEIRKKRNESVHKMDAIDSNTASRVLNLSRELILKLDAISTSSGYEWLEKNREKVIELFKTGTLEKCEFSIRMLREAWCNRDGAIWLELSEFFEVALIHKPEAIVRMFVGDEKLLNSWLDSAETQLFTDFLGGDTQRLTCVQEAIVSSLESYLVTEKIANRKDIAQKILEVIRDSEIREID
ncbi:HEPN domain-containing protein [Pseudoalteromonas sp. SR41-1]|uniref:HEPN domain-containing protein n=1 Tax=Pseudoalteromonas sp. SR41-1 TaxID=2760952 RepID=UPI0016037730|nr:HEPN domain-containing protein [Pseudoalteromonas sp. SR41-1]MBB1279891.1 HEPN domain-containing protein [Pseudoalteromonas sp. SR41-1]